MKAGIVNGISSSMIAALTATNSMPSPRGFTLRTMNTVRKMMNSICAVVSNSRNSRRT
jgi:hypothetical protein